MRWKQTGIHSRYSKGRVTSGVVEMMPGTQGRPTRHETVSTEFHVWDQAVTTVIHITTLCCLTIHLCINMTLWPAQSSSTAHWLATQSAPLHPTSYNPPTLSLTSVAHKISTLTSVGWDLSPGLDLLSPNPYYACRALLGNTWSTINAGVLPVLLY